MGYYWLSFCDPDRPKGTQFLGICIVEAADLPTAITKSHVLECNPGGEVLSIEFEPDKCPLPIAVVENRFLNRQQMEELFGELEVIDGL